jgi:hypothetical protein
MQDRKTGAGTRNYTRDVLDAILYFSSLDSRPGSDPLDPLRTRDCLRRAVAEYLSGTGQPSPADGSEEAAWKTFRLEMQMYSDRLQPPVQQALMELLQPRSAAGSGNGSYPLAPDSLPLAGAHEPSRREPQPLPEFSDEERRHLEGIGRLFRKYLEQTL